MGYKEEFIEFMVGAGVLTFGDFVTKSGRKTPYFINTGNYKTGAQADALGKYYAAAIHQHLGEAGGATALFGPAYKGIPLAVAASQPCGANTARTTPTASTARSQGPRRGRRMVGYKPQDGDKIAIIEDVVTAGTAVRETIALFEHVAKVQFTALFVSVDRMERGTGEKSALQELQDEYGIRVFPIVTVREIIAHLHNRPVNGKIYIDDAMKDAMEAYLAEYGAK